ncbi:IS3 family transposase [Butyrivibrio fibrisolvens]|uniref:IS3 family transposase n=1 Tax=Butyrivibrio fibrisolvens TaxID=831 RepID=UPI0012BD7E8F
MKMSGYRTMNLIKQSKIMALTYILPVPENPLIILHYSSRTKPITMPDALRRLMNHPSSIHTIHNYKTVHRLHQNQIHDYIHWYNWDRTYIHNRPEDMPSS